MPSGDIFNYNMNNGIGKHFLRIQRIKYDIHSNSVLAVDLLLQGIKSNSVSSEKWMHRSKAGSENSSSSP